MGFGTNYPGNPTAAQSPSMAPGPGITPTVYLPADQDGATWANLAQSQKVDTDAIAYLMNGHFWSAMQENFVMTSATYTTAQAPIPNYANWSLLVNGTHWSAIVGNGQANVSGGVTVSGDYVYWALSSTINNNGSGSGLGNSSQYSIEFDLVQLGASNVNGVSRIGLGDNAQLDAAANYAFLVTTPGASTWTLNVNGTTSVLSATYNPGSRQQVRIVGFGSATATGIANGSALTQVYINNVLATSVNACATTVLYPSFGMKASGNITGMSQLCNCITMRWNRF